MKAGLGLVLWTSPALALAQGFEARLVEAVAEIEPGAYALVEAGAYVLGLGCSGRDCFGWCG